MSIWHLVYEKEVELDVLACLQTKARGLRKQEVYLRVSLESSVRLASVTST
jgi:hypothetical protein